MLKNKVSQYFRSMQQQLFPEFENQLGPTTNKHREVITALDMVTVEQFLPYRGCSEAGRPPRDREALARAFVAKSILNLPTTLGLIDRIKVDPVLRRICGFLNGIPCEATFSNAFSEFSNMELSTQAHEALIKDNYEDRLVGHISRDSTAIDAREKPNKKKKNSKKKGSKKRGRPRKGEQREAKEPSRLEKQQHMNLTEMLQEIPKICDVGGKMNAKGHTSWWVGYKLHLDVDDHGIPISALVSSASMHDSQAAIPLENLTNNRVKSLYSLMDAAYNSPLIVEAVTKHGKIPIIDPKKPRGGEKIPLDLAKKERYKIRTTVERTNSTLKDDFGARHVRVKGAAKVTEHLMSGVLAMSALRIMAPQPY